MSDMITVGSRVARPGVNALVVNGRVLEQRDHHSLVKWTVGSVPTWHSTVDLRLVPSPKTFGTADGGMLTESTTESVAPITAHSLAVITYRLLGSRDLHSAYEDDPVVHYMVGLGIAEIAPTLRSTPGDRNGRARARAQFLEMVEEMQAPMLQESLREMNAVIDHMQRYRAAVMESMQFPGVIIQDDAGDDRMLGGA